jgi:integral membrane protein (TIGR01906 family)
MDMNKTLTALLTLLLALALGGCLLLTSVQITAFDLSAYEKSYDKYKLEQTTGLTKNEYIGINRRILGYLNGTANSINNWFNQKELAHMVDVKVLFQRGYLVRNISFVLLLAILTVLFVAGGKNKGNVGKALFNGSIVLVFLSIIMLAAVNSDFYDYFTLFHEILFTNDLWLLNPETDLLINMYPLEFFQDMASRILITFFTQVLIAGSIGYFVFSMSKKK